MTALVLVGREQKVKSCRQETDRSIQKTFALWCFPAWFSQASSADQSCGEQHTMLLCPQGLHHSSTTHNSSLWSPSSPGHSSQCLNTVPCWAPTHCHQLWSHSPRPQTAREGTDLYRVSRTWKHMHTLTQLTYRRMSTHHPIRPGPRQPLSTHRGHTAALLQWRRQGGWRPD